MGVCFGAYLTMTRTVAGLYRPRFLLISQLLVGTVLLTPLGLSVPFPPLEISLWLLIALSAVASAAGNYTILIASKRAEASLIAPLLYTQLISATAAGVLVFGDWPDAVALSGLVLIAASGLGTLALHRPVHAATKKAHREQSRRPGCGRSMNSGGS